MITDTNTNQHNARYYPSKLHGSSLQQQQQHAVLCFLLQDQAMRQGANTVLYKLVIMIIKGAYCIPNTSAFVFLFVNSHYMFIFSLEYSEK